MGILTGLIDKLPKETYPSFNSLSTSLYVYPKPFII